MGPTISEHTLFIFGICNNVGIAGHYSKFDLQYGSPSSSTPQVPTLVALRVKPPSTLADSTQYSLRMYLLVSGVCLLGRK